MISETLTIGDALLGIVWAIAAFSFKNIGYVLQKAGVNKSGLDKTKRTTMQDGMKPDSDGDVEELTEEVKEEGQLLKSPIWWIGQTITMLGAFSLIMAYGTNAPLPLVMPFMGVGLIVSVIFCKYYLKEEVTSKEWLSSLVIVVGIVLVTVVYEDLAAEPTELGSYFTAYVQPQSLIFFALAIGGLIIAIVWSVKNDYKYASVIFGIAAGDIGGTSLLFQTPFSKGLSLIFAGGEIVEAGFWWMFIVGVLGFAVGGVLAIVFENIGYMHGEGILVAPLYSTFQMLFPILGGIIVFDQWAGASPTTIAVQTIGVVIITLGTFFLSYSNSVKKKRQRQKEQAAPAEQISA